MRESLTGNDIPSGCLRPDTSRIVRLSADMGVEFSIAELVALEETRRSMEFGFDPELPYRSFATRTGRIVWTTCADSCGCAYSFRSGA